MNRLLTAVALVLAPSASAAGGDLHVTYLGNEGFLLESGGRKVLIDALVSQDSMKAFVDQSFETAGALRRAEKPYHDVELVLATHVHGDHFHALEVGLHLKANENAVFVSTEQAVKKLKQDFGGFDAVADRVHAVTPQKGEVVELKELGVTVFNLHHGSDRPSIENNGYLIDVGGHRLLHIGDTEATAEELKPLDLPSREIDVGFVPSWYLDAEPWVGAVEEAIQPKRVVVMHLAPRWNEETISHNQHVSRKRVGRIREAYPEAVIFEEYGAGEIFPAKVE